MLYVGRQIVTDDVLRRPPQGLADAGEEIDVGDACGVFGLPCMTLSSHTAPHSPHFSCNVCKYLTSASICARALCSTILGLSPDSAAL